MSIISFITCNIMLEVVYYLINSRYKGVYWKSIPYVVSVIMFIVGMKLSKDKVEYHIPYTGNNSIMEIRSTNLSRDVSSELVEGHGLGAGIVTVVGSILLSGIVETIKNEVIECLKEEIYKVEVSINTQIDDIAKIKRESLIYEYKNYVGENMRLYRELLDGIYNYNNNKFIGLSYLHNTIKNYLNKLLKDINTHIKFDMSIFY